MMLHSPILRHPGSIQLFRIDARASVSLSKSAQSINSRGGFGLHQINPLVRFSSMKCKNLRLRSFVVRSRSGSDPKSKIINKSVDFPKDYNELVNQARRAAQAALKDDKTLLEVEFPTAGLDTVPGDEEGGIEMNTSIVLMKEFCTIFKDEAPTTRIFFPDAKDMELAKTSIFDGTSFKLDYLTKPNGLEDFGFGSKVKMADRVQSSDTVFVVAYPYFNVNAVEELYKGSAAASNRPIIVFNGELDRIRSGYYPSFFYPKLGSIAKEFLPKFETVYYIHNFKGRSRGVLFRMYPGPWQVLQRVGDHKFVLLHEQASMPSLKEVALNILPTA
uniref:DUF1995 domain-containing protein n=1 Tax=Physcomitrium patens TaxID=3218 RepID=A0A7I4AFG6_PHYPA